jgi:hypothetical protein
MKRKPPPSDGNRIAQRKVDWRIPTVCFVVAMVILWGFISLFGGSDEPPPETAEQINATTLPTLPPTTVVSVECQSGTEEGSADVLRCGPARAVVNVGGTTIEFVGGQCESAPGLLVATLGVTSLAAPQPGDNPSDYLAIIIGDPGGQEQAAEVFARFVGSPPLTSDGPYEGFVWVLGRKGDVQFQLSSASVVMYDQLTRAEFAGSDFTTNQPITGQFSCV